MAVSMTGYGKSVLENENISIKVEIRSVNSRFLDLSFKTTRGLTFVEEKMRTLVKSVISRGKVEVYIGLRGDLGNSKTVNIDEEFAINYYKKTKELAKLLKIKNGFWSETKVFDIANIPGVFTIEEKELNEDEIMPLVTKTFTEALDSIKNMKIAEGKNIELDMKEKIQLMKEIMKSVEKNSEGVVESYREKLKARIAELNDIVDVDETRIAQEVAFFADKSSIDEEIIRLNSHIKQFEENLSKNTIGRKLDFIIQEMNREVNTICSKSASLELTNDALELKSIIEKLREQAQNIE